MKKRMFVGLFIFTVCLFHLSIPDAVFGSAQQVFDNNKELLLRQDVSSVLPDALRLFSQKEIQEVLDPVVVEIILDGPRFLQGIDANFAPQFIALLSVDEDLRALFRDEQFYNVLKNTSEINKLIALIERAGPPPPPLSLTIVSGYGQEGKPGAPLADPFVVEVLDQYGDPLSGVSVTFKVRKGKGDGTLSAPTARTNRVGRASTTLTLGSSSRATWVDASVVGRSDIRSQTFTATSTPVSAVPVVSEKPNATTLLIVSGYGQEGKPGAPLADPFVVEVLDQYGDPFSGVSVTFKVTKGGGTLSPTTARPNTRGQYQTYLTLGKRAGANWVGASVVGRSDIRSQTFTATATATQNFTGQSVATVERPPVYWIKDGLIYRFDDDGEEDRFGPKWLQKVNSLAVDVKGSKVYCTQKEEDGPWRIVSVDFNGNYHWVWPLEAKNVPYGIAVDTERGKLYVTSSSWRKVQSLDVNGKNFDSAFIPTEYSPKHIAVDMERRRLYWTETVRDEKWRIKEWRIQSAGLDGENRKLFEEGLDELGGIAVAGSRLYWTEKTSETSGYVTGADLNRSTVKNLVLLEDRIPLGITADASGNRLYWTTSLGNIESLNLDRDPIAFGVASGVSASPGAPSAIDGYSAQSVLLANYPNPFNPETWIPYQLSAASDVTVSIYSVDGSLVRRLVLGHQAAGIYHRKSRAAYWDGRNEYGERVASGLYFYTLTAGDFSATRKMLIRK